MRFMGITLLLVQVINRHGGDFYLWRLTVFKCPLFSLMVHRFLAADDECLHDHPWPFVSFVLAGGYWETSFRDHHRPGHGPVVRNWYGAGSLLFRRADWAHRIELQPGRRTMSVVLSGPRLRTWGFWTKGGWRNWRHYVYRAHCAE
jgi:hypothetical protein